MKQKIMKACFFVLLAAFMLLPSTNVSAKALTYGDFIYYVFDDKNTNETYILLTEYGGQESVVEIPDEIDGVQVQSISGMKFKNADEVKEVVIGKYVTKVDYNALSKLPSLEKISVVEENEEMYSKDGVLFSTVRGNKELVYYPIAKKGKTYTIPKDVKMLATDAFYGNKYLKKVTIGKGITTVYESFAESNIETIIIPDTTKVIDEYAFSGCDKLEKVVLGKGIVSVDKYAFEDCNAKIEKSSYLKKQKDGSYVAKVKVGSKEYDATAITKLKAKSSSITLKKKASKKLKTTVYVNKKAKGTLSTTAILKFKSSNTKVAKVTAKGVVKGLKKGTATITVQLRTADLAYKVKVKVR